MTSSCDSDNVCRYLQNRRFYRQCHNVLDVTLTVNIQHRSQFVSYREIIQLVDKYPLHAHCWYKLCIRSSLLCESVSLRVVMRLVHATGKTWCKILYQQTMYVISLSNISIKTNFKQIARVELKLTHVYTTLRDTTFCPWRHVICCCSFINVTLLFDNSQRYCILAFFKCGPHSCRKYWSYVHGNENMTVNSRNRIRMNEQ
jgi:hypothetical protein